MPLVESLATKALSRLAKWAPTTVARIERRIIANHVAIQGTHAFLPSQGRFSVTVAVAPSRAVRRLEPGTFADHAYACAKLILGELPFEIEYSGSTQARFTVADTAVDAPMAQLHILNVHSTGLVDLQWGLDVPYADPACIPVSLDEIAAVLTHMYRVAHHPTYHGLHKIRKTEKYRRLDWRVGVSPSVASVQHSNTIPWTDITTSGRRPSGRAANQWPGCPIDGYASWHLQSVKPTISVRELFGPVLEQFLVDAGYVGVEDSVADVLEYSKHPVLMRGPQNPAISG